MPTRQYAIVARKFQRGAATYAIVIKGVHMLTRIDINDRLIRRAMRLSGLSTRKAVVEAGLRLLVATHDQGTIRQLRGKVDWESEHDRNTATRIPLTPGTPP